MQKNNLLELVMIVKNSGDILKDCLSINKKYIDHWTILDTGSSDNTVSNIKEELKDIPGNLYIEEFVDFSHSRNRSLELSSKKCKYQIILDDSYIINGGDNLRKFLNNSKDDCIAIKIGKYINRFLHNDYFSKRIIKTSKNLRYKYRIHEDIYLPNDNFIEINDPNIFIHDLDDKSHSDRTKKRFKKDIELLLLDFKDNPNDPRPIYYLGKTYLNIDEYNKSLYYYDLLYKLKDIDENYLFTSIYESVCIKYILNEDKNVFEEKLINLYNIFKNRSEPGYKLCILYRDSNRISEAEKIIDNIILYKKPKVINTIIDLDIYEFGVPYLFVEIKLLLKKDNEAIPTLKILLKNYPYNQELLNNKYFLSYDSNGKNILDISSVKLSNNKTIVIHITHIVNLDPSNLKKNNKISGSEYMAINLAKEFVKLKYRVFIIGSFENKEKGINFEGTYDGIEYIDHKYFNEFALRYVIDYLIISRDAKNLIYYNNIKNVYLWVHDVLPVTVNSKGVQMHKEKFKYLISISKWQKKYTVEKLNIPGEYIYLSRNAIYSERFLNKNIEKVPYRFIYTSCAERGLDVLIDIIPKIKEKYPLTTLYLFVNKNLIYNNTLKIIENTDYIFLNDRVNQDQVAIELLKSDIWLYPTTFLESYCITALEAMASKCLVATVNYGGLGNIVEGKGILCEYPIEDNVDDLIKKLFMVMGKPSLKNHLIDKAYNWAITQTYESLAKEWINDIF